MFNNFKFANLWQQRDEKLGLIWEKDKEMRDDVDVDEVPCSLH